MQIINRLIVRYFANIDFHVEAIVIVINGCRGYCCATSDYYLKTISPKKFKMFDLKKTLKLLFDFFNGIGLRYKRFYCF